MENGRYWQKRFAALEDGQYQKSREYIKDVEKQFRTAANRIQMDIERWYYRLADNNGISYYAAKKLLKADELEEFHWDVDTYIKYGKENGINQKWMKELENASAKVHINYLKAMKIQVQQEAEKLYQEFHGGITEFISSAYKDRFYKSAFEIAKGTGVGHSLARFDNARIEKVIKKPWAQDGMDFSSRIWKNKDRLVDALHTELVQCIIRGQSPDEGARMLAQKMDTGLSQARRLIYTECAAAASAAQKDCFKELGVEEFQVVATLDSHTSRICRDMDGKHFPMADYQPGVTAPPLHCNCRSTTCPYFDDEFTKGEKRAERGKDGKTHYVPADMTYKQWQQKFINDNKNGVDGNDTNTEKDREIWNEKILEARKSFSEILSGAENNPHNDRMFLYNSATEYNENLKLTSPFAYNIEKDFIEYNPLFPGYELYDLDFVQAHELSHRMDIIEYHSFANKKFIDAIERSRIITYNRKKQIEAWFLEDSGYKNSFALSDIISALSDNVISVPVGHNSQYWKDKKNVCLEVFANISAMEVLGDSVLDVFKEVFPELYDTYKELVQ